MKKVQVTVDQPHIGGYFYASPQNKSIKGDFLNLSDFFEECQCSEIYAPEILDAVEIKLGAQLMEVWTRLLGLNGKIFLGGTDPYLLAKISINRGINLKDLNDILFNRPYFVRSLMSIEYVKDKLIKLNLQINNISIDYATSKYVIEAEKINV